MKASPLALNKLLLLAFVLGSLFMSPFAIAEVTNGKFPMCDRHSDLMEIWNALSNRDERQVKALLNEGGCFFPKAGINLSVIKKIGVVYKVRIYIEDDSAIFYTSDEGYD